MIIEGPRLYRLDLRCRKVDDRQARRSDAVPGIRVTNGLHAGRQAGNNGICHLFICQREPATIGGKVAVVLGPFKVLKTCTIEGRSPDNIDGIGYVDLLELAAAEGTITDGRHACGNACDYGRVAQGAVVKHEFGYGGKRGLGGPDHGRKTLAVGENALAPVALTRREFYAGDAMALRKGALADVLDRVGNDEHTLESIAAIERPFLDGGNACRQLVNSVNAELLATAKAVEADARKLGPFRIGDGLKLLAVLEYVPLKRAHARRNGNAGNGRVSKHGLPKPFQAVGERNVRELGAVAKGARAKIDQFAVVVEAHGRQRVFRNRGIVTRVDFLYLKALVVEPNGCGNGDRGDTVVKIDQACTSRASRFVFYDLEVHPGCGSLFGLACHAVGKPTVRVVPKRIVSNGRSLYLAIRQVARLDGDAIRIVRIG